MSVPILDYDRATGTWDFELVFDAALAFPELGGLTLPTVQGIALRPDGIAIPSLSVPNLSASPFSVGGFALEPLAFRMDPLVVDWFDGSSPSDWGFEFDLALTMPNLPQAAPPELRNASFSILGAGWDGEVFTGGIEVRNFSGTVTLPLGGDGIALELDALGGALAEAADGSQDITVTLDGDFLLPNSMRCAAAPDGVVPLPGATVTLSSSGQVSGTVQNVVPSCPVQIGPLAVQVTSSDLVLAAGTDRQEARLDLNGTVKVPGVAPGDTVTGAGALVLDLMVPEVVSGSIALTEPFRWDLPADEPFLSFVVSEGRLDAAGLVLSGTGALAVGSQPGDSVAVAFNDLTLGLPDFRVTAGSVAFDTPFALEGTIQNGTVAWQTRPQGAGRVDPSRPGLLVTIPDNATLGPDGLSVTGSAGARLDYGGEALASLTVEFLNNFLLGTHPVGVRSGRANLVLNNTQVAHVDSLGFHPGNFFGVLPVPDTLGLPTADIAFLRLRDGNGNLLVESSDSSNGMRLATRQSQPVQLVIPALAAGNGPAPTVDVEFDIVVDPQNYAVVSGSIEAAAADDAPALADLAALGVPLELRGVSYAADNASYAFTVDLRVALPEQLDSLYVDFRDVTVTANGLEGEAVLGDGTTPVARYSPVSGLTVTVDSARVAFGPNPAVGLGGAFTSDLFSPESGLPDSIGFAAGVDASGVSFAVDDPGILPMGQAQFDPQALGLHEGIEVTADDSEFTIRFSGVLSMPSVSDDFELTVDGLEVGTNGVVFPTLSLASTDDFQVFSLFGATFTLKDVQGYDALVLGYDPQRQVVTAEMAGELTFLDNTSTFHGLTVASDGRFTLAGANLLSQPVAVVPGVLRLTALGIESNKLRAELGVTPPAPFDQEGEQTARFLVSPDGTIEGGADIVLLNEDPLTTNPGAATNRTVYPLGGAVAVHPRYLALSLDLQDLQRNSNIALVADLYLDDKQSNRVQLGTGPTAPGLDIGFDGAMQWGNFQVADTIRFDYDAVRLAFWDIYSLSDDFGLGFTAQLSLATDQVSGDLELGGVEIGTGGVSLANAGLGGGGSLEIAGVMSLTVNSFEFSSQPTTLTVPAGGLPASTSEAPSADSTDVPVSTYLRLGGEVEVTGVMSGGVKEFLAYKTANGGHLNVLVDSASLSVGQGDGSVAMNLDFLYQEDANGFTVTAGGGAAVAGQDIFRAVGEIGKDGSQVNMGLFFITSVSMPIIPPNVIVMTELGGGFFYHPTPHVIDLVKSYAKVSSTATQEVDNATGTDEPCAAFLYGSASIVSERAINGRLLLSLTPSKFALNGAVDILCIQDPCTDNAVAHGGLAVNVGFNPLTVDSNVDVTLGFDPLISGGGGLQFYVYGADTYGVMGHADVEFVKYLSGSGDFFYGPPGFMASATISKSFDFWIISVSSSFQGDLWYVNDPGEFGAYMKIGLAASVLGGTVSAEGNMYAALIAGNSFYIYGVAELSVDLVLDSWSGSVWAKFRNGNVGGGFGRDPEMDKLVDRARQAAQEMARAKQDAVDNLNSTRPPPSLLRLSDAELAGIYARMAGVSQTDFDNLIQQAVDVETGLINFRQNGRLRSVSAPDIPDSYVQWYRGVLRQAGSPPMDSAALAAYADTVDARIQRLNTLQSAVSSQLSALQAQIAELEEADATSLPTVSPVRNASLTTEPVVAQNGQVTAQPTFDVDTAAARSAQAALRTHEQQVEQMKQQVLDQITTLQDALNDLRAALTDHSEGSLLAYARMHAEAVTAAQRHFAEQANHVLMRQDWVRATHNELESRRVTIEDAIDDRTSAHWDATTQYNATQAIKTLADGRVQALNAWSGTDTIWTRYTQDTASYSRYRYRSQARIAGKQLWYGVADAGLRDLDRSLDQALDSLNAAADARLDSLRTLHEGLSRSLDRLYLTQAELTGTLYDLIDRYLFWVEGEEDLGVVQTGVAVLLNSRKQDLEGELKVPELTGATVQVQQWPGKPYMSRVTFLWAGSHPKGTYEFRYKDVSAADAKGGVLSGENLYSAGAPLSGVLATGMLYHFPDYRGDTEDRRAVLFGVRGGAGYIGLGRAEYTATFAEAPGDPVSGHTSFSLVQDSTPPDRPYVYFPDLAIHDGTMWTSDSTQVVVEWGATDDESGIQEYTYAFGVNGRLEDTTSVAGRTRKTMDRLNLSPDSAYTITVWATNGAGQVSPAGTSRTLRYDPTPPEFPQDATFGPPRAPLVATFAFGTFMGISGNPYQFLNNEATAPCPVPEPAYPNAPLQTSGMMQSGFMLLPLQSDTPRITLKRPDASDPESGVLTYYYHIGTQPARTYTGDHRGAPGWKAVPAAGDTMTVEGAPLNFSDSLYVTLVAVNHAGAASEPLVYGPFQIEDESKPTTPSFCSRMGNNGKVMVKMDDTAVDPETGIEGYVYRVRDTGTTVVRAWPDSVDWQNVQDGGIRNAAVSLTDGARYYVDVRAVNGQGTASNTAASGPILYDASPPETPSVSTDFTDTSIRLTVDAPQDPHSGLMTVQYAIYNTDQMERMLHGDYLLDWRSVTVPTGQDQFTITISYPNGWQTGTYYQLRIRSVNGVGQASPIAHIPIVESVNDALQNRQYNQFRDVNLQGDEPPQQPPPELDR